MKKEKVISILVICIAIVVAFAIYFVRLPDVRSRPLTMREFMILNPDFGETIDLFELRRGEYAFHLYHYHFGERVASEQLNHVLVSERNGMVTFYSNPIEENVINFGMRAGGWHANTIWLLELELGGISAMSVEPAEEIIRNLPVDREQILLTYQFDSNGRIRILSTVDFDGFAEQVPDLEDIEHLVIITITRVE